VSRDTRRLGFPALTREISFANVTEGVFHKNNYFLLRALCRVLTQFITDSSPLTINEHLVASLWVHEKESTLTRRVTMVNGIGFIMNTVTTR
jgi:hypothetical protein